MSFKGRVPAAMAVALVLAFGIEAAPAAEPTISVMGSEAASGYRDVIDRLISGIDADVALAGRSSHDTPALYLDLNRPLEGFPDFGALGAGDQALLRATKKTYDLYRALGGDLLDRFAVLQRRNNRYYIAIDGEGGRWVVSVEEALAVLLKELVTAEQFQSAVSSAGSKCSPRFHCLLMATYLGMIESIASVPRNTTVTLEMTGDGLGGDGGGDGSAPILLVPDSMVVHDIVRESSDKIMATVSISDTAPLGMNVLSVYSPGHNFRSLARLGIEVLANPAELEALATGATGGGGDGSSPDQAPALPGSGEFRPLIDDHTAEQATATPLVGTASGRLGSIGDADLFRIVVEKAGTLSVISFGPTDVVGTLETGEGSVIASDDDGGERYNFSIKQPVAAGTYFLRVTHCCAGQGDYRLSVKTTLP